MAGLKWDFPPSKMLEDLVTDYATAIRMALMELAEAWAPIIEDYMKTNAPWKDRSSNARQTLNVRAREFHSFIVIDLSHGMNYGIYLELANAGAYAIINPTLDKYTPLVWKSVLDLFK